LDYIECVEAVKADYESDVTDIEDEDSYGPKRMKLGARSTGKSVS